MYYLGTKEQPDEGIMVAGGGLAPNDSCKANRIHHVVSTIVSHKSHRDTYILLVPAINQTTLGIDRETSSWNQSVTYVLVYHSGNTLTLITWAIIDVHVYTQRSTQNNMIFSGYHLRSESDL